MKNGKRPTRRQKHLISVAGWNPDGWLVVKNLPNELHIVSLSGKSKKIIQV